MKKYLTFKVEFIVFSEISVKSANNLPDLSIALP